MKNIRVIYMLLIYSFLYIPIFVLIAYSFNSATFSTQWQGFSLKWYEKLFENESLLEAAINSVVIALLSSSLATIIGLLASVGIYRYKFWGKKSLYGLIYSLIMLPEIVMGISLLMLFIAIGIPLGFWGLLVAHITFCVPFVVVTILGRLSGFDKNIIEAAKDLGANEFKIFIKILLPILLPAIIAGFLLSFTLSLDDVIISFFVTSPDYEILPLKIYSMVRLGVKPEVNALCTIMFILTLLITVFAQFLLLRRYK